jgi:cytochrome P450
VSTVPLPWDGPVDDPVAALGAARAELGDTFTDASGRFLFLFSPAGVRSFYALAEEQASKGVADVTMLLRKVPEELFAGRRTLPHELFGRDDVSSYLANLDWALEVTAAELGADGRLDVFDHTRRLGHRMGLASWAGRGSAAGERFDRLVFALDRLDAADAFVHPDLMGAVAASDKAVERGALADAAEALGATLDEHDRAGGGDELLDRIVARWDGEQPAARRTGVAHYVVLVHLASMSNLFAGLGWTIVELLARPDLVDRVRAGDRPLVEASALESIRVHQRSIMMRRVLAPVEIELDDGARITVEPGTTVATLLPLTNLSAGPGLDRWDPERWNGRRLRDAPDLPTPELVTAFGHGRHTCPAQPFSLAAITRAVTDLVGRYDLVPEYEDPRPVPAQIGGVARAAGPCPVRYARR